MGLPLVGGLIAGKIIIGALIWKARKNDISASVTDVVARVPAELLSRAKQPDPLAGIIQTRHPLPETPIQIAFPNNGLSISLPEDRGEFQVFAYTPAQGQPVILAAGYDRKRKLRIVPILVRGSSTQALEMHVQRIATLCRSGDEQE